MDAEKVLPGYKFGDVNEKSTLDTWITRIKGTPDNANPRAVPAVEHTQVLPDLMVEYMRLRNSVPGTYIKGKRGAKGLDPNNEKAGAQQMLTAWPILVAGAPDVGGKATKDFAAGMKQTFDADGLSEPTPLGRLSGGSPLAQHILTVFQAYPGILPAKQEAVQRTFLGTILKALGLTTKKQRNEVGEAVAPATGVGFSGF